MISNSVNVPSKSDVPYKELSDCYNQVPDRGEDGKDQYGVRSFEDLSFHKQRSMDITLDN
jgi:hypothetical protein